MVHVGEYTGHGSYGKNRYDMICSSYVNKYLAILCDLFGMVK